MKVNKLVYDRPTSEIFEVRIERAILETSPQPNSPGTVSDESDDDTFNF